MTILWSNKSEEYGLDGLLLDQASGGPRLIERYHYIGDGWNLTVLNNDTIAPAESQRFSYDDAGRLLTASGPYGGRTDSYDKVGNRLSEVREASGTTTTQSYVYPATSNKLSAVTQGGTTVRTFGYDASLTTVDTPRHQHHIDIFRSSDKLGTGGHRAPRRRR